VTKSERYLRNAITIAESCSHRPMTRDLTVWIAIGNDRLERVESSSERCGRAWTLHKLQQAARNVEKALAANNRGTA